MSASAATEDLYCVRGCGSPMTHIVSHIDIESDAVVVEYGCCKLHVPAFLMGHNDRVYARFRGVEVAE